MAIDLGNSADEHTPAGGSVSVAHGSVLFFASNLVGAAGFFVAALLLARALGPSRTRQRGVSSPCDRPRRGLCVPMKIGLGQATSVLAAQRPEVRPMLLSNLLAFSLAMSLVGGALVGGGLYLFEAEPAGGSIRTHFAILGAGRPPRRSWTTTS